MKKLSVIRSLINTLSMHIIFPLSGDSWEMARFAANFVDKYELQPKIMKVIL